MDDQRPHPTHEHNILSCTGPCDMHVSGSVEDELQWDAAVCRSQRQVLQVMTTPPIHQGQKASLVYWDGAALWLLLGSISLDIFVAQEKRNYAQLICPWFTPF